ncbi:MAG: hypothetical protein LKF37_12985 [Lentilactobacillus diolivorans]|jgi:hypothetical protein|uniref:Uncharacterized protein n=1 Tax=Paucilactobacillus vaccinostercus DSM 20634 TaxID=1423813 RepID=A0A0R2A472_9LACO|nr:hypothetical protein [Paucilactobacillus vaccinostercus]KRM61799.1 hypothetical protein FC26_GL001368 [Paucilactobacillus vaccinostercus DSM 20634]MCH4165679.1 hypothetical protein [Lentilactobacillus diolivorans]
MYLVKVGYKWIGKPNKKGHFSLVDNVKHAFNFKNYDHAAKYSELVAGKVQLAG